MSPDLSFSNAANAASALPIPGAEPVEIFQAELFTILEKLASGATTLSAEDELEEMESLDEHSSAKPSVNEQSVLPGWANPRPAVPLAPELRVPLSLDCFGSVEAPPAEEAVPENSLASLDTPSHTSAAIENLQWSDEAVHAQPPREHQSIGGFEEQEAGGDVSFSGEIAQAQVDEESPSTQHPPRNPGIPKIEAARHSEAETDNAGTQPEKQAPGLQAAAAEPRSEIPVSAARQDFEPVLRAESKRGAEPPASRASMERVESVQKPAATGQQPIRDFSMGITSEQTRVGIHVRESEGTIQVSVRTPDAGLSAALQQNLDELTANLNKEGMESRFWTPAENHSIETQPSEGAGDSGHSSPDWQGRGNSGGDGNSQQRQNQRSRPEWMNTFTTEQDREAQDSEVISWPFNSQISQAQR